MHIVDFLRCDRVCVLRVEGDREAAVRRAIRFIGQPYDFDYRQG